MSETGNSNYTIHDSVVISIVRKAIQDIPGFVRLAGSSFVSDLAELVTGSGKKYDHSITISTLDNGAINIEINVVCEFGTSFATTAAAIQKAVYEQVTDYTGIRVAEVKVVITDVEETVKDVDGNGDEEEIEVADAVMEDDDPADAIV